MNTVIGKLLQYYHLFFKSIKCCFQIKHGCTIKLLYKRLPVINWLPKYNTSLAVSDLVAGITVGLTVLPQAIAFANVAGIPAHVSDHVNVFMQWPCQMQEPMWQRQVLAVN